jgi:hypothetical protein
VKQAHILTLLVRRSLLPEPAKAEASSSIDIGGPINKALQSLAPFIRRCPAGGNVNDFIADLTDEVGGPVGAVVAACAP